MVEETTVLGEQTLHSILDTGKPHLDWCASDVLEIGCGNGWLGYLLSLHVRGYTGIDTNFKLVTEAHGRLPDDVRNVTYLKGCAGEIPFQRSFDAIVFENSFHCCHPAALQEAKRVITPSGIIIIEDPSSRYTDWDDPRLCKDAPEFNRDALATKLKVIRSRKQRLNEQKILRVVESGYDEIRKMNYWLLKK